MGVMRASGRGWAATTIEESLDLAKRSAEITHNHPEGIKGAQATAAAIFMTVGDANNKWILTEDTKHVINVCMLMRYDGQVHFVKDDALLSKVREIMRQIK